MATLHAFQTDQVLVQDDGLLEIEQSVDYWSWIHPDQPEAASLAEAAYWLEVESADDTDDLAITQYELEIPDDVYAAGGEELAEWIDEAEANWFPGAAIVRQNTVAERLRTDKATRERIATPFWNCSDARDDWKLPATQWAYQVGNQWVAVVDETIESWFDEDFVQGFKSRGIDRLLRPITSVPKTGRLIYWDSDGVEHQIDAASYKPEQVKAA